MKAKMFLLVLVTLLAAGLAPSPAVAQEGSDEPVWSEGTVMQYIEGQSITIKAPGEDGKEEVSLTFVITEETGTWGEIAAEEKVEIEHKDGQALYIQTAEEK